jgi:hypothetical protein
MAAIKANKTTYKHLTRLEKRIVKMMERQYWLELSVRKTYRTGEAKYGIDFRNHPGFQVDFEKIFFWDEEDMELSEKISRLEDNHGVCREQIMKKHRLYNRGKSYGGSF